MDTLEIAVGGGVVSGLLQDAPAARACYVFAHGAGAGMTHPFMAAVSTGLFERGVSTLRYQFPYMERGRGDRTYCRSLTSRSGQP
jgi:predicted alpha/beta-hydrolase family hydrolase